MIDERFHNIYKTLKTNLNTVFCHLPIKILVDNNLLERPFFVINEYYIETYEYTKSAQRYKLGRKYFSYRFDEIESLDFFPKSKNFTMVTKSKSSINIHSIYTQEIQYHLVDRLKLLFNDSDLPQCSVLYPQNRPRNGVQHRFRMLYYYAYKSFETNITTFLSDWAMSKSTTFDFTPIVKDVSKYIGIFYDALKVLPDIDIFVVPSTRIKNGQWEYLCEYFRYKVPVIKRIHVYENFSPTFLDFVGALKSSELLYVKAFNFFKIKIESEYLVPLKMLILLRPVSSFFFFNCYLKSEYEFPNLFRDGNFDHIKTLYFEGMKLELSNILSKCSSLKKLLYKDTKHTDVSEIIRKISDLKNSKIEVLCLSGNLIKQNIDVDMNLPKTLRKVDLSSMTFSADLFRDFLKLFLKNERMALQFNNISMNKQELLFYYNDIQTFNLRTFGYFLNPVSEKFVKFLYSCSNLRVLSISGDIKCKPAVLIQYFEENLKLKKLVIDMQKIDKSNEKTIMTALSKNRTIRYLEFINKAFNAKELNVLADVLLENRVIVSCKFQVHNSNSSSSLQEFYLKLSQRGIPLEMLPSSFNSNSNVQIAFNLVVKGNEKVEVPLSTLGKYGQRDPKKRSQSAKASKRKSSVNNFRGAAILENRRREYERNRVPIVQPPNANNNELSDFEIAMTFTDSDDLDINNNDNLFGEVDENGEPKLKTPPNPAHVDGGGNNSVAYPQTNTFNILTPDSKLAKDLSPIASPKTPEGKEGESVQVVRSLLSTPEPDNSPGIQSNNKRRSYSANNHNKELKRAKKSAEKKHKKEARSSSAKKSLTPVRTDIVPTSPILSPTVTPESKAFTRKSGPTTPKEEISQINSSIIIENINSELSSTNDDDYDYSTSIDLSRFMQLKMATRTDLVFEEEADEVDIAGKNEPTSRVLSFTPHEKQNEHKYTELYKKANATETKLMTLSFYGFEKRHDYDKEHLFYPVKIPQTKEPNLDDVFTNLSKRFEISNLRKEFSFIAPH